MFLYNFNIAKANFPFDTLTYSSSQELQIGQICFVEVRGITLFAVVKEKSNLLPEQIKNLKPVLKPLNLYLGPLHLEFLNKVAFLTFNSFNNLFVALTTPLSLIKNLESWDNRSLSTKTKVNSSELNYVINKDWNLVIKEIIKKYLEEEKVTNILVIYPEKNSLEKSYNTFLTDHDLASRVEIFNLLTTSNKKLLPVLSLLYSVKYQEQDIKNKLNNPQSKVKIILGNKNTLFANLQQIDHIIIVDEANPSYISEQRIYFDTREIAFWASLVYSLNLTFVSTLPSVRFYHQNKEQLSSLKTPEIKVKFLERTTRQSDFENILIEINQGGLIVGDNQND